MIIYKVCDDCIMAIANNDYTGLDHYYNESESQQRMEEIKRGMEELGSHIVCMDEQPDDFCVMSCDCCGTHSAGKRHYIADITNLLEIKLDKDARPCKMAGIHTEKEERP